MINIQKDYLGAINNTDQLTISGNYQTIDGVWCFIADEKNLSNQWKR